jgi:RHS repeat-associated protein
MSGTGFEYDSNGNVVAYTYDAANRLDYAFDAAGRNTPYRYDAGNRKTNYDSNINVTEYDYDERNLLILEPYRVPARLPTATSPDVLGVQLAASYVFGSYIDEPLCMVKANGDRFFYSTNDLYSVYALTNGTGNVVERYMYDPYGKVTVLDGNGNPRTVNESLYGNPWTFTGRRLDGETGLMYYRWRMYETGLGRFVSRDPIGYRGGIGLYGAYYVPNAMDPLGLDRLGNGRLLILRSLHCWDRPKDSRNDTTGCGIVMVGTNIEVERPNVEKKVVGIYFNWVPRRFSQNCECCCPGSQWAWVQHINEGNGWSFDNGAGAGGTGPGSDPDRRDPNSRRRNQPVQPPAGSTAPGTKPPQVGGPGWLNKPRSEQDRIRDEERRWEQDRWKNNPFPGGGPGGPSNPGPTTMTGDSPDSVRASAFRTQLVCLSTGDVWFDYSWNKTGGPASQIVTNGERPAP